MVENGVLSIKVEDIDEKQVPELIQEQFSIMGDLRKEITKAVGNVFDAKDVVINEVGIIGFSKKEAIDNLQKAALSLANAQVNAMSAQQLSFEYQQKLADITKFLFRLGLTNIAMNRVVVEELECKLRNATEEELDDLARSEIQNLLKQLKMQQDLDKKQSDLLGLLKEQAAIINAQAKEIEELKFRVEEIEKHLVG